MKPSLMTALVVTNLLLIGANLFLIMNVKGSESATARKIQELRTELDAKLAPQALAARFGEEAGKSMQAFQQQMATYYDQFRAQAEKTANDLKAAAEPVIADMKTKTSEMGQTIGASTQSLGEAIEDRSKDLNKTQ